MIMVVGRSGDGKDGKMKEWKDGVMELQCSRFFLILMVILVMPLGVRSADIQLELVMPGTVFVPGAAFSLNLAVDNPGPARMESQVFVVLTLGDGSYWFYPRWVKYPPEVDSAVTDFNAGWQGAISIIEPFPWPTGAGEFDSAMFLAAVVKDGGMVSNLASIAFGWMAFPDNEDYTHQDMLTPEFYHSSRSAPFRDEVNRFVYFAQTEPFHHPLMNASGDIPDYTIPEHGKFGAGKGPGGQGEHHPAVDMHVGNGETDVMMYASYDGWVSTYREADKYRQYLAISKDVSTVEGQVVGKLVTIYGHIDLDLDEADSLVMNGQYVQAGDLISRHLYAGTVGGPHLHFEIRYYRPEDAGYETYYGFNDPAFTEPSAGIWSYGYWDPDVGYGFGDALNHGVYVE